MNHMQEARDGFLGKGKGPVMPKLTRKLACGGGGEVAGEGLADYGVELGTILEVSGNG